MDIDKDSHQISRLEVVETGRRRRWTDEEKLRIVAQSFSGSREASATARRHGISRALLFSWRRAYREGRLGGEVSAAFVPVEITASPPAASPHVSSSAVSLPTRRRSGLIEIEFDGGCRIRVDRDVDADALCRVLEVLRRR